MITARTATQAKRRAMLLLFCFVFLERGNQHGRGTPTDSENSSGTGHAPDRFPGSPAQPNAIYEQNCSTPKNLLRILRIRSAILALISAPLFIFVRKKSNY